MNVWSGKVCSKELVHNLHVGPKFISDNRVSNYDELENLNASRATN